MVDKFIELFTGYQGDFGIADMSSAQLDTDKNKLKPNYEWAGRPITQGDYRDHIAGKISIGIQPCRLDKTVQFGCIDIDSKDYASFKVENYLALFQQFKLPLVPLLSKSGGLHCYLFLKEPIPAVDLISALKSFLLPKNILVGTDPEFEDGPPCLALCSKRKLDDGRDRFMYNYMVFAKKKYKDKWPDQVAKANYSYLEDPWDKTKLDSKITAWKKDTAGHTCYEDPIQSKCMRTLCYSRPFGVKSDSITMFPDITDFEIIMYAEPEYRFNVVLPDGTKEGVVATNRRFITKQTELLDLIWEQTGIYHEPLKPKDFRAKLTELRKGSTKISPPAGTQIEDRLKEELYQYCVNGPRARNRVQINSGSCLTEEGHHFFRFNSFIDHLGSSWKIPEERIAQKLKDKCDVEFNHSLNVDGKTIKVCRVKQLHIDKIEYKPVERKESNY